MITNPWVGYIKNLVSDSKKNLNLSLKQVKFEEIISKQIKFEEVISKQIKL